MGEVEPAGVAFEGDFRALCLANLHLRTVSRVLVRVDEFRAATFHELEKRTARIDWSRWITPGRDVALRVTCRKSRLYHSGAVAERMKLWSFLLFCVAASAVYIVNDIHDVLRSAPGGAGVPASSSGREAEAARHHPNAEAAGSEGSRRKRSPTR